MILPDTFPDRYMMIATRVRCPASLTKLPVLVKEEATTMAEDRLRSLPTELWYPYGGPEMTHVGQVQEGITDYSADSENYRANSTDTPRPDRVVSGS